MQKPYRCEVFGCQKRYTDPSSLRKHVKNHTKEEQDQVKMTRDNSKGKIKEKTEQAWIEPEYIHGNPALMSGGGVVNCPEYDQRYKGQIEQGDLYSYGWGKEAEDRAGCYRDQRRQKEEEERLNFYSTPLYLEV